MSAFSCAAVHASKHGQCAAVRLLALMAGCWMGQASQAGSALQGTTTMPAGLSGCSARYHLLYVACQVMQ